MRILSATVFTLLLSAPAFAADLGMYRPGTPYGSAVAPGADVCANQCAGDAQCRGWNYVKPNPRAAGVCEFMSSVSTPVPSQISISGESLSARQPSARLLPGSTNTVRVGTSTASTGRTVRVGQTPQLSQAPSGRRIAREAVPQRPMARPTTAPQAGLSLTEQQNRFRQPAVTPQRPVFRPILDGIAPQRTHPQQARQQQVQTQQTRPQQARPPQGPARVRRQAVPQRVAPQPTSNRPPIGRPIPPQGRALIQRQTQPSAAPVRAPRYDQQPGAVALSPEQARKSLFGRLNDDVKAVPADDLPIATAVPSVPVSATPIETLAGGR